MKIPEKISNGALIEFPLNMDDIETILNNINKIIVFFFDNFVFGCLM